VIQRIEDKVFHYFELVRSRIKCFFLKHRGVRIHAPVRLGKGVVIDPQNGTIEIGKGTTIHAGAQLLGAGGYIKIGTNCSINSDCLLYGHGGLIIGDNVRMAAKTIVIPANHRFDELQVPIYRQGENRLGIRIGDDVWIGAGVIILDGVNVATGSVIGAGSVLTRSTEDYGVYVGNPARLIRRRGETSSEAN
jgi:acetyltransferase-like isoleucine patch superfamily enzyme